MNLLSTHMIIILGILFFVHGIFFIHAIWSIHNDRYRKIFTSIIAIYLCFFIATTSVYLFVFNNALLIKIARAEILFLPVGIIITSIVATRYYDIHRNTRDQQIGVAILITLLSLLFLIQETQFLITLAIAVCAATIAWELYFYNEQMSEIRNKESKINGTKTEFLSFATHQLRSPLTQLKWGLNAVADNVAQQPKTFAIVQQLRTTLDEMMGMVNDLLDVSKIEQGGLVIKKEPIDLVEFLDVITREFSMIAQQKQLQFSFQSLVTTAPIIGDRTKLRQVFNNIIDNAIKYTVTGSVVIKLEKHPIKPCYQISIIDTGSGIAPDEIPKLFLKFSRGNAGKIFIGGSGLGLYLSKKIIELHNGTISAMSPGVGMGSVFTVSLLQKIN